MPKGKRSHKGHGQYAMYKQENRREKNKKVRKQQLQAKRAYLDRYSKKINELIPQEINKFITPAEINMLESFYLDEAKHQDMYKDMLITSGPKTAKGRAVNRMVDRFYKRTNAKLPRGRVRKYFYTTIFDKIG